jgi:hypothetical protein
MTQIQLPHPLPGGGIKWNFVQTTRDALTGTIAGTAGLSTVSLAQVPQGEMWMVQRMSVQCNSTTATTFVAYFNQVDPRQIADSTSAGNGDVADEHQPIELDAGDILLCVWSGCIAGAVGSINVQRQVFRSAT